MMTLMMALLILLFTSNCLILYLMAEYLGVSIVFTKDRKHTTEVTKDEHLTEAEKRFKERSEKELEAFQELMNYNPNIAYGVITPDKENDR